MLDLIKAQQQQPNATSTGAAEVQIISLQSMQAMYSQTTRPLTIVFVFSLLFILSLASLITFIRLHIQRRRRISDSTPKPRYRRHHRLWIIRRTAPEEEALGREMEEMGGAERRESSDAGRVEEGGIVGTTDTPDTITQLR